MNYKYRGLNIDYDIEGFGKPLILLHGWGTSKKTFTSLTEEIKKDFEVHLIDMIGFGSSDEPLKPLSLNDYVLFLRDYICRFNINDPIILGHSFGGRVALKYVNLFGGVKKLILVDSAGIKRFSFKSTLKVYKYKFLKRWYRLTNNKISYQRLLKNSGSSDYKVASPVMKRTLSLIVKEDLKKEIKKIQTETLIIWGRDDKVTPYKDALYLKKHIKNSGLVTFENTGHFPYLENKGRFNLIIKEYLKGEDENDLH